MNDKTHEYAIMTMNLWTDGNHRIGINSFRNRSESVLEIIHKYEPDLIGVQELTVTMLPYLKELFEDYGIVGESRHSVVGNERNSVLYNKHRFNLISHETLWLSETPHEKGSKHAGAQFPRIVTLAYLQDKDTDEVFTFANTHLEWASSSIRNKQIDILVHLLSSHQKGSFLFVTGDFNCTHESEALHLFNKSHLKDAVPDSIGSSMRGPFASLRRHYKPIDHIYISPGFVVYNTIKIKDKHNGIIPTDHFPIITYVGR